MKALRFALIALVACTMVTFSSCNNDPEPDPNPNNGGVKEGTAQITFGEVKWNPACSEALVTNDQSGNEYMVLRLYSTADMQTKPFVIMTIGTATGKHMASTDAALSFDYFESIWVTVDGIQGYLGDWWAGNMIVQMGSASFNITAIDPGSLTISMEGSGQVWNVPAYNQGQTVTKDYKVVANKYKMSPMAAKGGANTFKGNVEGQPVFVF